MYLYSY